MTTYTIDESTYFEVSFNRETLTVEGYEWATDLTTEPGEEDANLYCTHSQSYSGYTLSEALCKALIEMDKADDWDDAIWMLAEANIEYVSSDEGEA